MYFFYSLQAIAKGDVICTKDEETGQEFWGYPSLGHWQENRVTGKLKLSGEGVKMTDGQGQAMASALDDIINMKWDFDKNPTHVSPAEETAASSSLSDLGCQKLEDAKNVASRMMVSLQACLVDLIEKTKGKAVSPTVMSAMRSLEKVYETVSAAEFRLKKLCLWKKNDVDNKDLTDASVKEILKGVSATLQESQTCIALAKSVSREL